MPNFTHIETPWFTPRNLKALTNPESGERFYYDPIIKPRVYYPSVTTVLQNYKKKIIDAWRKRIGNEAADKELARAIARGNAFHSMAERYLQNEDPSIFMAEYQPAHRTIFNQVRRILDKNVGKIHIQEQPLLSKILGVAGRVDLIGEWNGVLSVIDFKGSRKLKKRDWIDNYFAQTSAYAFAYWEMTKVLPKQTVVLISSEDFSVKAYINKSSTYLPLFQKEAEKFMKRMIEK